VGVGGRLHLLAQLIDGSGVTVTTGPLGAAFWTGVSPEVVVHIVPDGVELEERNRIDEDNALSWSLRVAGLTATETGTLLRGRERPPKASHQHAERWQRAASLRDELLLHRGVASTLVVEEYSVTVITDEDEQLEFLIGLDELAALDWEWNPLDPDEVHGLSVATRSSTWYLPVLASDYISREGHGQVLRQLFTHKLQDGLPCIFHQGRADLSYQFVGDPATLSGKPIHDTLLMMFLAYPESDDLGLKPATRKLLAREPSSFPGSMANITVARGARYAGADARNTFDLFKVLTTELIAKDQWRVYVGYEQPLMPIVASMEKFGQSVDVHEMLRLREAMIEDDTNIREAVQTAYGYDLAVPDDTRDWLKDITGYRPSKLDQRAISKWPQGEVDVIMAWRRNHGRLNNVNKIEQRWVERGCPEDFRLYPKFNQAGKDNADSSIGRAARTGRFTSSGSQRKHERAYGAPNFQNQPASIRTMYVAPPGMKFTSWDYSAMELRVAASLSGDPVMLGALNAGEDLHELFRLRILALTGIDVGFTAAKSGNFEQLYGGRGPMLVRIMRKMRAHITLEVADAIVDGHAATFPTYHEWAKRTLLEARKNGFSETLFGRRRYLPDLYSADSEVRGNAERASVNHVIQGTAADILKLAMVRLSKLFSNYGGHLAITVHDEVCGWVPVDVDEEELTTKVKEAMTQGVGISNVPLLVKGGFGKSWKEAH